MTRNTRRDLLATLVELGNLHPGMRFGQLFEFASLLASDQDGPDLVQKAADEAVLEAARAHVRKRAGQLAALEVGDTPGRAPSRVELVRVLEELGVRYPDQRLGQLVARLAEVARSNTYDVEDEQLLDAARQNLSVSV
jgi:hypothetical protein